MEQREGVSIIREEKEKGAQTKKCLFPASCRRSYEEASYSGRYRQQTPGGGGRLSKKKQTQMMHTKKIKKSVRRKYVFKLFI